MSTHLANIEGVEMEGKLPEVRLANKPFRVVAPSEMAGDQPQAVEKLAHDIEEGLRYQTLLGVTGSGKTFTMAKTIEAVQKPTLVLAPNKTLAAQLAGELKEFFPDNAVVYFVSYYDYYQPEAYVPASDTFIEKDASINEEVEKLRHAATSALLSRRDVVVVASVSCIYGIGSPLDYAGMAVFLDKQVPADRDDVTMASSTSSTTATTTSSPGARSACAAMPSTCSLPMRTIPSAWSSGETRSRRSPKWTT